MRTSPSFNVFKHNYILCFSDQLLQKHTARTGASNADRLMVLDVVESRPVGPLRRFPSKVGFETTDYPNVWDTLIICSNESLFLQCWSQQYVNENRSFVWPYNSGDVPTIPSQNYHELIHVENATIFRPSVYEIDPLWLDKLFTWMRNHVVNLSYNCWKQLNCFIDSWQLKDWLSLNIDIRTWNGTLGKIARYVYHSSPRALRRTERAILYKLY